MKLAGGPGNGNVSVLIGVNLLDIEPSKGGGEERYLRHVLATMRAVQPEARFLLFTDTTNHDSFGGWDRECVGGQGGLFSGNAEAHMAKAAKAHGIDVLFSPLWTAPLKFPTPMVVFALDLRRLEQGWDDRQDKQAKILKRVCAAASAIVAPSEFTRRRFLELLDVPLNKVVVAPLGIPPELDKQQQVFIQAPYLLVVGDTHGWKNIDRLMAVFDQLAGEVSHSLVVVGQPFEAEPADWGKRVIRIESCSSTHLASLYQHCDCYIQPARYEGSGVTILEAMRAEAPIATSRTGAITEVAGEIPFFFNPESVASMLGAVRWALEETPELRQQRTRYGRQMAGEFTWERCAWKTLSAFKRI